MTNETRIAIGEGGRGLGLGSVLEDKDASEKLKIQTNSLITQSDSQSDSPSDSDSRLTHLAKTYSADEGTAELTPPNPETLIQTKNDWGEMHDMLRETCISYTYHNGRIRLIANEPPNGDTPPDYDNGITDYE